MYSDPKEGKNFDSLAPPPALGIEGRLMKVDLGELDRELSRDHQVMQGITDLRSGVWVLS